MPELGFGDGGGSFVSRRKLWRGCIDFIVANSRERETQPRCLRRQLVDVVGSMLQIAEAASLEEGTRHLAIEFVITLITTGFLFVSGRKWQGICW